MTGIRTLRGINAEIIPACFFCELHANGIDCCDMFGERRGEVGNGGIVSSLVFGEDILHYVCAFESNGELLAFLNEVRAGEEGSIELEQGGGGEVEGLLPLAVRAVLTDVLQELGGALNGFLVNAVAIGDDGAVFNVGQC